MHVYMYTLSIVFGGVIFLYKLLCANSNPRKEARVREREGERESTLVQRYLLSSRGATIKPGPLLKNHSSMYVCILCLGSSPSLYNVLKKGRVRKRAHTQTAMLILKLCPKLDCVKRSEHS